MKILMKLCLVFFLTINLSGCGEKKPEEKVPSENAITFYITRHGQTEYNVQGLAQGWCDSPLTEKGIAQAKALGEGLSDVAFAAVYSSTSKRAIDTAKNVIGDVDIEIQTDDRLKEMHFGSLEEQPNEWLWHKEGVAGPAWDYYYENGWVEYGGENFYIVGERMMEMLEEITQDSSLQGKNVLISTHGMSIISLMYEVDPIMADTLGQVENCSITKIVYDNGEFYCTELNSVDYLK